MKFSTSISAIRFAAIGLLALAPLSSASSIIESSSLSTCQANSGFSASLFNVLFTPSNNSLAFNVVGVSTITGNVSVTIDVAAYGYPAVHETLDPCALDLSGLCPLSSGQINIESNLNIPKNVVNQIPGIAYTIPDLDGVVTVKIFDRSTTNQLACVQAALSNGKTVYQKGVGWSSAAIAGLALLVSAIVSGLGYSNTASHIAANAMALFGFFQGQALFGMTAVDLPPIVASWTQNFQWSMGIIRIGFIQDIATWYQRATGGTPSTVLSTLSTTSVSVQKRSLDNAMTTLVSRAERAMAYNPLIKRTNANNVNAEVLQTVVVRGIERVGFRANIELTDIFMTGYIFFLIFIVFVILLVAGFKLLLEGLAKWGKLKNDRFQDFRNGWSTVLKGILFRLILIGFPQMVTLCFWELTKQDSAGEIVLAAVTIVPMILMLAWACFKVISIAKRSIAMHKNPAYMLYSDPVSLHKWGFLYVQFKATCYWFITAVLVFLLAKCMFVAFAQSSGRTQAIAIVVLELSLLVAVCIIRPYMDKRTNGYNIAICVVNVISAIFLLFFTQIFGVPGIVIGVMGVIFFILNAAFALILLVITLVSSILAILSKNPDVRYQPMRDDRGSFIKSQTNLNELDALGATARGEGKTPFKDGAAEEDSYSSSSWEGTQPSGYSAVATPYNKETGTNPRYSHTSYDGSPYAHGGIYERAQSMRSTRSVSSRVQPSNGPSFNHGNNASPWQKGAGYER